MYTQSSLSLSAVSLRSLDLYVWTVCDSRATVTCEFVCGTTDKQRHFKNYTSKKLVSNEKPVCRTAENTTDNNDYYLPPQTLSTSTMVCPRLSALCGYTYIYWSCWWDCVYKRKHYRLLFSTIHIQLHTDQSQNLLPKVVPFRKF